MGGSLQRDAEGAGAGKKREKKGLLAKYFHRCVIQEWFI